MSGSQEEIAEMKRKMKTMNNHVDRLRDEISGKELALAKDEQEHKRLDKDNEALKVLPPGLLILVCVFDQLYLYSTNNNTKCLKTLHENQSETSRASLRVMVAKKKTALKQEETLSRT